MTVAAPAYLIVKEPVTVAIAAARANVAVERRIEVGPEVAAARFKASIAAVAPLGALASAAAPAGEADEEAVAEEEAADPAVVVGEAAAAAGAGRKVGDRKRDEGRVSREEIGGYFFGSCTRPATLGTRQLNFCWRKK